jgi:hypothetical protein
LSGSASRTCRSDGTWSGAAPTCVVGTCASLAAPTNGSVSAPSLTYGSTATYSCNTGYVISGASSRSCQADGTWSGAAPTCGLISCPALSSPANGTVAAATTTYGATATYGCNAGFMLSGAASRTCQADGTWSGTQATCTAVTCGALASPANGTVVSCGTTAAYACNAGYVLSSSAPRTCQADGTWSGVAATCTIASCGTLVAPTNGSVSAPTITYGSTATYGCNAGFALVGSTTRTCQADGTWSGAIPTCQ